MRLPILICVALLAGTAAAENPEADIVITATPVEPARLADEEQQLRRNLRQMRELFERDRANDEAAARGNTSGLFVNPTDAPSVGVMREQLARSMERLENRCFGIEAKAQNGNVILICGDNSGTADNQIIKSSSDTTVVLPPAPPAEPATPAEEGKP